jgi:DNA segregation ATPase FtsK/SpoIIIE, S-DNA-T family
MAGTAASASVFVSYAHESEDHRRAVLTFVQQLRRAGVDCWLDQFDEIPPPTSWPHWMYRQLSGAEVVLVVCSESYRRRVEDREAPGVGLGARWEGAIITQELYEKPSGGRARYVPVVFSADDVRHIPWFLRPTTYHVVAPDEPGSYATLLRQLRGRPTAVPEPLGAAAADPVPVPVAGAERDRPELPSRVRLLDLMGRGSITPDGLRERWRTGPVDRGAVLGVAGDGVVRFDPAADGPHCLIGGETGTGKSNLLRTMVASLAVAHPPDDWRFVLLDYKGGYALEELAGLPHVLAVVTDVDRGAGRRLLRLLRAEMRRRERALAAAGASNFGWLDARRGGDAGTPVPRLLVVLDEFASMIVTAPELTAGLTEVARQGRNLGIHLVFATMRPEEASRAQVMALVPARICLRVGNPADSRAVLGATDAASLPGSCPGRALVSLRGRPPRAVQVAELDSDDAGAVVAAAKAAVVAGLGPRWRSWPPPLLSNLTLDPEPAAPAEEGFTAVVGLADLPDELDQVPWRIRLDGAGAVLAVGAVASGKSVWLATVAASLASRYGEGWDLFVAGPGDSRSHLAQLAQCRMAADLDDRATALDMVQLADAELTRRRIGARLLAGQAGAPRAPAAGGAGGQDRLLVAVDRLDLLLDQGTPELVTAVRRLAADGPAAGVHLVATTDPAGASRHGLAGQFSRLLLLWLADPERYADFGIARGDIPDLPVEGRGLWLPDRVEVQVARIGGLLG